SRNCDDMQTCTTDFCSARTCQHASSCDPSAGECTYAVREGHGYWLCPMPVSFSDARSECARLSADVVTITDRAEHDFLWSLGMRDTWIGYTPTEAAADGGFGWLSGPSDYSDWADGQPDNDAGEACAYLSAAAGGAWQSHDCNAAGSG